VNGGTVALFGTVGAIDETGTLIAGTLTGSAATGANLAGATTTSNQIGTLLNFAASDFTLFNGSALTVAGQVLAGHSATIIDTDALTVSGTIAPPSGTTAIAIELAGATIDIPGLVSDGGAGTTRLAANGGTLSETGILIAGTLSGGSTGITNLAGATATTNQIANIDAFNAGGGFTLRDGTSLSINGELDGGLNTTVLDKGALTIASSGGLLGGAIDLMADNITIAGRSSDSNGTTHLVATSGTISQTGDVFISGTLSGSAATDASFIGSGDNLIKNLGSFTAQSLTLRDLTSLKVVGPVVVSNSVTITDPSPNDGTLTVTGTIAPPPGVASIAVALQGAGISIDTAGLVSDGGSGTTSLVAGGGGIFELGTLIAGTLTGGATSAPGLVNLFGASETANQIHTLGSFTASDLSLRDGVSLNISGPVTVGTSLLAIDSAALTVTGTIAPPTVASATDVALRAATIDIPGLLSAGPDGQMSLFANAGTISETGTLITGALFGSVAAAANLKGTAFSNQIGTLVSFTAAGIALDDGIPLTIGVGVSGGPSLVVNDKGALAITGGVTATAISLTADSISIPGVVTDGGGGTVGLFANTGAISETGTLIAGTLTGSAATSASLTGATTTTNHIGLVNGFTATSGFTLDGGVALAVGGTVAGGTNVTILDKGALTIGGMVTATSVGLTADSITIPGNVSGAAVMLVGTVGAISETGTLVAGTLTGSAATSATLTGASATTNQVGTLNGFKAGNGFTLNDGTGLTVAGTLAGGPNATIVDTGALAINGAVTAAAVGLTANSITVSGNVGGNSAALDATNGAIIINGAVSATAVGLTADGIVVSGNVTGNSASLNATNGAITINGVVSGTTTSLFGTSIVIPGIVNGNSVTAVATAGAINETGALNIGTLTGAAATSASFTGTNSVASLGQFSSNGLTLIDNSNLGIIGVVNAGTAAAINVAGSLNIGGALIANTIALNATNGISSPGAIAAVNSVNLVTNGSISETGALITDVLTGSAIGNVTLTGNAANNQVAELGRFTSNGTFTLNDNIGLLITGPLSAPKIVITDANSPVTLADGAIITTSGTARPPGAIANADLPTAATSGFGAFLSVQSFTQVGDSTIEGNPSILRIDVTGPGNITLSQNTDTGLTGNGTWLILGLQTGQATGSTFVQNLDVIQTGGSGSTQLTGTVGGFSGPAAAGAAGIQPGPGSNFRFNSCPIASVNCVLVSALAIPTANPLNDINVGSLYNPNDQDDLLLPIVSDQDY
jgi:hypothetical protein